MSLETKGELKKDCPSCLGECLQGHHSQAEHTRLQCGDCNGVGRVTEYRWKTLRGINVKRKQRKPKEKVVFQEAPSV